MPFKSRYFFVYSGLLASLASCGGGDRVASAPTWPAAQSQSAAQLAAQKFGVATLKAGDFRWDERTPLTPGPTDVVISISRQVAYVYKSGQLVGMSTISSGSDGHNTPQGHFPILEKQRFHKSNRYSAAPMPFMLRLNWYGVALHGGQVPGYRASHGCVRLPMKFAERLFGIAEVGSNVYIEA